MRSGGGGCTTSSLPVAARAPPGPEVRLRHPLARAFPRAPSSRSPPPSTPGRRLWGGGTMSQRVRRNGSPTPAGALAGGAVGSAGGPGSRLQPMRATVPFQLKQQQQHGSPTRGGGGGGNNGGSGGASGPSGGGGGGPRTASRSTSPTRGGGSAAARTSPTVATQTGASVTSTRGTSPTRGTTPGARSSPPRPQPPPPLLGTVSSPSSSPTHLWPSEVSAAPSPARVRHRRRSPEQGRPSAEKRSPSAPVCKAGTWRVGVLCRGVGTAALRWGGAGRGGAGRAVRHLCVVPVRVLAVEVPPLTLGLGSICGNHKPWGLALRCYC